MSNEMKNADQPANPTQYMDLNQNGGELYCDLTGLTKREMFAIHAMSALIGKTDSLYSAEGAAEDATHYADELLKELDR